MQKNKSFKETFELIQKQFGKGSLVDLKAKSKKSEMFINSGSQMINKAIGAPGYPRGRITEIYGPESSGKTTLALHAVAECQKSGGIAAFIDAEHALDLEYAKSLGVDIENLLISQPDSGEQALEIVEALSKTNEVDLIIIDSVAALVPEIEATGEISDQTIGAHARLMSKGLRILNGIISKTNTGVIFINQLREKVGVIYGSPEITTGGRALKFYSTLRIEVRKDSLIKDGTNNIGLRTRVTISKNKISPPYGVAYVEIYFGKGFDYSGEIIDFAVNYEVIDKSGSWYSYKEHKIGQGKSAVKEYLSAHPDIYKEIEKLVINKIQEI